MSGKKKIIYWDACLFIALLKGEEREDPNDMLGIKEQIKSLEIGEIDLATSTLTLTEVCQGSLSEKDFNEFQSQFNYPNYHLIDVSRAIAILAGRIRDKFRGQNKPTVSTPDAIHLATAIWFNCNELYTFDGDSEKQKNNDVGLLNLPQPIIGEYAIPIIKPSPLSPTQLGLNLQGNK